MKKIRRLALLAFCCSLLIGCVEENSASNSMRTPVEREILSKEETIYKVRRVDWLYGNWMQICNPEKGCHQVDLHKTGLRNTIKENVSIKVTEIHVKEGNREWIEKDYDYSKNN